jgi:hypothetical protein
MLGWLRYNSPHFSSLTKFLDFYSSLSLIGVSLVYFMYTWVVPLYAF